MMCSPTKLVIDSRTAGNSNGTHTANSRAVKAIKFVRFIIVYYFSISKYAVIEIFCITDCLYNKL